MWIGVTERFRRFHAALQLSEDDIADGLKKQLAVRQSLQRGYYGSSTDEPPGFIVGSWRKRTAIEPPSDVDVFMPLPIDVYERFNGYQGNVQSALLQEVKGHLLTTYPQTSVRGDGQVVVVGFNTVAIEVVPVFNYDSAGQWVMPDTNQGGRWRTVRPLADSAALDTADSVSNNNTRPLIQMMKAWRQHCSVPIRSFMLETVAAEFITNYEFRKKGYYYYDWFMRDFFAYLINRRNGYFVAPNSGEVAALGEAWHSRAVTASDRALAACDYERADYTILAGEEWQKIFGTRVPVFVS